MAVEDDVRAIGGLCLVYKMRFAEEEAVDLLAYFSMQPEKGGLWQSLS